MYFLNYTFINKNGEKDVLGIKICKKCYKNKKHEKILKKINVIGNPVRYNINTLFPNLFLEETCEFCDKRR